MAVPASAARILVIAAREDLAIMRETRRLLDIDRRAAGNRKRAACSINRTKSQTRRKTGTNQERRMKIMATSTKEISAIEAISAYGPARSTIKGAPLSAEELEKIDAYWRASLYLCMGMLYLKDNPLLREPLRMDQIKARLLGHWGSDAGQAFTYVHFNRLINKYDLNAIFISGPGHGAPAVLSQAYLEGTYSEIYPDKSEDLAGMQRFFKQFSFPAGSAATPLPKRPEASMRGVSWATASRTPSGPSTITRI